MKAHNIILIAALALLFSGCCQCTKYEKLYGRPLVGTQWQLIQMNGRAVAVDEGYYFTLAADNRFSGKGNCNNIMGDYYIIEGGKIHFKNIASTRMMCPDQQTEQQFIEMLDTITDYQRDGGYLYLFVNGELLSVFRASDIKE